MRSIVKMLVVFALVLLVFGQEKQEPIMFKHWFDGATDALAKLEKSLAAREKAFTELADKMKEGDKTKLFVYALKTSTAHSNVRLEAAGGGDFARNLEKQAKQDFTDGNITEAKYDESMALVKKLRGIIDTKKTPTDEQKKIYTDAYEKLGEKPFTSLD